MAPASGPDLVRRLGEICGSRFARAAGPADLVAGVSARWVAAPGSVDDVSAVLRVAAQEDLSVVARGAGSKIDWGAPAAPVDIVLDTGRLAGIRPGAPDELAVEIGAGTPLRAVQAALDRVGQRLPLDPPSPGATVGGVVAADEAGPLRQLHGTPADQLVGLSYVDASGAVTRSAGWSAAWTPGPDPARLLCGSLGALGVVVSATLRVQPTPASRVWVSRSVWTPLEMHDVVRDVRESGLAPAAIEVDLRPTPPALGAGARTTRPSAGPGTLSMLLEGGPAEVAERVAELTAVAGGNAQAYGGPPDWWRRYPFGPGDVALQLDVPVGDLHAAIYALRDAAGSAVPVRGSVGVGVVHAALPGRLPPERVAAILAAVRGVLLGRGGTCVVVAAPTPIREAVDLWGDLATLPLLRRIKHRFDPHARLAPGRFPGNR